MAVSLLECQEGSPIIDPARETTKDRGGRIASVSYVLSGSGAGSINLWCGYLGFVGANLPEAGASVCGIPQTCDVTEDKVVVRQDLEKRGIGEGDQIRGHLDTRGVY